MMSSVTHVCLPLLLFFLYSEGNLEIRENEGLAVYPHYFNEPPTLLHLCLRFVSEDLAWSSSSSIPNFEWNRIPTPLNVWLARSIEFIKRINSECFCVHCDNELGTGDFFSNYCSLCNKSSYY
jgi:hypothetical protein